jgi:hypothetical protein
MPIEASLLVLHGLVVRKAGTAEQVAALLGLPADTVRSELDSSVAAGEVIGAKGMFMPTPAGRARLEADYPQACAGLRADEAVTTAADRFEAVNKRLLALLTRWQTISRAGTSVPNDHSDPDYDAKVIDELGELHERVEPVLGAFIAKLPRYAAYRDRLAAAYDKALGGDNDYVTGVRVDSYHTVWHELHEDLLRTLGRKREE